MEAKKNRFPGDGNLPSFPLPFSSVAAAYPKEVESIVLRHLNGRTDRVKNRTTDDLTWLVAWDTARGLPAGLSYEQSLDYLRKHSKFYLIGKTARWRTFEPIGYPPDKVMARLEEVARVHSAVPVPAAKSAIGAEPELICTSQEPGPLAKRTMPDATFQRSADKWLEDTFNGSTVDPFERKYVFKVVRRVVQSLVDLVQDTKTKQ